LLQNRHGIVVYTTASPPRLRVFGHLARIAPKEDRHRVIAATLRPSDDWRRPVGRPRTTWLRTIDDDLQFSPWTSGSTRLRGRQETETLRFGIKSSVRQRCTLEFASKEEEEVPMENWTTL